MTKYEKILYDLGVCIDEERQIISDDLHHKYGKEIKVLKLQLEQQIDKGVIVRESDDYYNNRYRKKPIVIEANQLTKESGHGLALWCSGILHQARFGPEFISIQTLEGDMRAEIGDWIIKGIKGEFYPCKPDIFEKTYEAVK